MKVGKLALLAMPVFNCGATAVNDFLVEVKVEHINSLPMPIERTFASIAWKDEATNFEYELTDDGEKIEAKYDIKDRCYSFARFAVGDDPEKIFSIKEVSNVVTVPCIGYDKRARLAADMAAAYPKFLAAYKKFRDDVTEKVSKSPVRCVKEHPLEHHGTVCDQYSGEVK